MKLHIGPYYWTGWLIFFVVSFAISEGIALATGGMTLSRYVWTVQSAWPLLGPVVGIIIGILLTHFWWGGIVSFKPVEK